MQLLADNRTLDNICVVWPNEIYSMRMGYCPALRENVFEVLVDLLYKIPKACAKNANPL